MKNKIRYILCKIVNGINVAVRNDYGFVSLFDDKLDANIERIYLQPDYSEKLILIETTLQGEYHVQSRNIA